MKNDTTIGMDLGNKTYKVVILDSRWDRTTQGTGTPPDA